MLFLLWSGLMIAFGFILAIIIEGLRENDPRERIILYPTRDKWGMFSHRRGNRPYARWR